jgi:phosphoglycolate phosphatase-like HAD superfamily hydrolase
MHSPRPRHLPYAVLLACATAIAQSPPSGPADPLPSWNAGAAKQAIVDFVQFTTDTASQFFVPPEARIATFDQDGTLWVEHPLYTQALYCLEKVPALVAKKPELKQAEPFKTVLAVLGGDRAAAEKLTAHDLEVVAAATLTGMTVEQFALDVKLWLATARDARWKRPYTDLAYLPMVELLRYLRAHGFKTYIVTGGGQDFVRVYAQQVYGIPPEQVVGTAGATKYGYATDGIPVLRKEPKLLFSDNGPGKPEGIHLFIGRHPLAAFGNSTGDQQMLEYTAAGAGVRLEMLILHDDARREYAYGPARGLPATKVGTFTQLLLEVAKQKSWIVVSMKNDWRQVFGFEGGPTAEAGRR